MTFIDKEHSREDGRPIPLYAFKLGSATWRYAPVDRDIEAGGFTWKSAAITDDGNKQTGETTNDAMTIDAPSWIAPAQLFSSSAPSSTLEVEKWETHEGESEILLTFVGEVSQVNVPEPGRASIVCETLINTMDREGLRLTWQRSCPFTVYDELTCRLDKADFETDVTILSIDGFVATVELSAVKPAGYFNGGFIQWNNPFRGTEYVQIESHAVPESGPVQFVLFTDPGEMHAGVQGTCYPGCNFEISDCSTKFDNRANYGGFKDMPGKSPFDGTPVF